MESANAAAWDQAQEIEGGGNAPAATTVWQALAQGRRSTRRFLHKPIPDGWLEEMLVEGRCAPSGANLQPGELFLV